MRHLIISVVALCMSFACAIHESFNFVLPAAQRRCFFETLSRDSPAHKVEAFVLSGGNLDVLLTFHGPLIESDILKDFFEEPIFHETIDAHKEIDSETLTYTTDFKPEKAGTYAICLDNRNSRFMSKVVQVLMASTDHEMHSASYIVLVFSAGRSPHFQSGDDHPQSRHGGGEERRRGRCSPPKGVAQRAEPAAQGHHENPAAAEARPPPPRPSQRDE